MLDINSIKLIVETLIANPRCGDYRYYTSYMFCTKYSMFIVFKAPQCKNSNDLLYMSPSRLLFMLLPFLNNSLANSLCEQVSYSTHSPKYSNLTCIFDAIHGALYRKMTEWRGKRC